MSGAAARETALEKVSDAFDRLKARNLGNAFIEETAGNVGTAVVREIPKSLVDLGVAVFHQRHVGFTKSPGQMRHSFGRSTIPPIRLRGPVPCRIGHGMVEQKIQPLRKMNLLDLPPYDLSCFPPSLRRTQCPSPGKLDGFHRKTEVKPVSGRKASPRVQAAEHRAHLDTVVSADSGRVVGRASGARSPHG